MALINGTNLNDNNTYQGWPFFFFYPELKGTSLADSIFGKNGNDILQGYAGDDYLDGGTGVDTMYGGAGNDTYIVDNASDKVIDSFGGIDRVNSLIDYTLPSNIEDILLLGSAAIDGQGNSLNNSITGNTNSNVLKGAGGDDRLFGNDGNDILNGGVGNDILSGGPGNDQLTGDIGNDEYEFYSSTGIDTIISFNASEDAIGLNMSNVAYNFRNGLEFINGHLRDGWYFEGNGSNGNGNQLSGIFVDTSNGYIWYNPTTNIPGDSYHFATVDSTSIIGGVSSLSAADFISVFPFDNVN